MATILCIDDNESALRSESMVLQMAGYAVLTATDANTAMELFASSAVDIVISDHLLQGSTGTELAAEMKRLKPHLPIVIKSGCPDPPKGMEHADLYIVKGEAPPVWLKMIADLLERRQESSASAAVA